jgi:hypothetical protein
MSWTFGALFYSLLCAGRHLAGGGEMGEGGARRFLGPVVL